MKDLTNITCFQNMYLFTQWKARITRQNDITIDGRRIKFCTTIDVSTNFLAYLPSCCLQLCHFACNFSIFSNRVIYCYVILPGNSGFQF